MPNTKRSQSADKQQALHRKLPGSYYIIPLIFIVIIIIICIILQSGSSDRLNVYYLMTMDTSVELRFTESKKKNAEQIRDTVSAEMIRLETIFSRSLPNSEINEVNRQAGLKPVSVSHEVIYVAVQAYYYARISDGAFDPTIAPLIDLWGFLGHNYRLPTTAEIENILPLVDYTLLEIDSEQSSLFLPREDMGLELGGIAKGYIVDRALEALSSEGIEHAFINAGGDIGLIGTRTDGSPWRIGVRHPREENKIIAVFPATGGAVVTSGDYERFFSEEGITYHHILDPETGMPARELASVTIAAQTAIDADALSTAVFVLGPTKGLALIESLPGVEGILIKPNLEILISSGLEGIVELNY